MRILSRSLCTAALIASSMTHAENTTPQILGTVAPAAWRAASQPASVKPVGPIGTQQNSSAHDSSAKNAVSKTVSIFHGLAVCTSLIVLVAATLARLKMLPPH